MPGYAGFEFPRRYAYGDVTWVDFTSEFPAECAYRDDSGRCLSWIENRSPGALQPFAAVVRGMSIPRAYSDDITQLIGGNTRDYLSSRGRYSGKSSFELVRTYFTPDGYNHSDNATYQDDGAGYALASESYGHFNYSPAGSWIDNVAVPFVAQAIVAAAGAEAISAQFAPSGYTYAPGEFVGPPDLTFTPDSFIGPSVDPYTFSPTEFVGPPSEYAGGGFYEPGFDPTVSYDPGYAFEPQQPPLFPEPAQLPLPGSDLPLPEGIANPVLRDIPVSLPGAPAVNVATDANTWKTLVSGAQDLTRIVGGAYAVYQAATGQTPQGTRQPTVVRNPQGSYTVTTPDGRRVTVDGNGNPVGSGFGSALSGNGLLIAGGVGIVALALLLRK